ncbi:MAG: VOC family protein [Microbacterium sp.]|jgi:catechol 2,3-dioxygenase-like lactoylglutathione lyase family enzyme|uniref:VOC family protein n=1 Tax=Microbacterium sp. TaxID=51671 RepID=UPI002839A1E9|nr:VOC family protein [Microbacterium sp.]MDR2321781.1 VOC family protein [Microbacterium sp.]
MPLFDHLGLTVEDLDRAFAQWNPVLTALGCTPEDGEMEGGIAWWREDDTELILYRAPEPGGEPHRYGRIGWQHLAFAVGSRTEVERLHAIAVDAGWTTVRDPKVFTRFSDRYYASFVEDDNGIRIEFVHNPPRDSIEG